LALETLESLLVNDNEIPSEEMFYSGLVACDVGKDWERAVYLLDLMTKTYSLSTFAATLTIASCASCGQSDEAIRILNQMISSNVTASIWTFNSVLSACAKSGNWKDSLSIFEKMRAYIEANHMSIDEGNKSTEFDVSMSQVESVEALISIDSSSISLNSFKVLYNTLIQALGDGNQGILVDEIYKEGINKRIFAPFDNLSKGFVDLHFHSVYMAKAAARLCFVIFLENEEIVKSLFNKDGNGLLIIVGHNRGNKLLQAIQSCLMDEFTPSIRSDVLSSNAGRLLVNSGDALEWIRTNKNTPR
jgi:pentatricopeptide repeat protein